MKNIYIKHHHNIKSLITEHHLDALNIITDIVNEDAQITKEDLLKRTKAPHICEARTKVTLLAKLLFNIKSVSIADYLNLQYERVHNIILTGYNYMSVDKAYRGEINQLIEKIENNKEYLKLNLK